MKNIADNRFFNMILLFTIIGEFIVPWILEQFYSEYNSKIMVMSVLGSPQSPVRLVYNLWLVWLGGFLAYTAGVYFMSFRAKFPVNESKYIVTTASKIHGIGAAIGFMALLLFPLLNGIVSFKQNGTLEGIISISSFVLSLIFFACFVMGDKEQFQNTPLKYEGLWERLTLFCMYIPFVYKSMSNLFF